MAERISVIQSPTTQQRFLILDAPTSQTLPEYMDRLRRENVSILVRICNRPYHDYDAVDFERLSGIRVVDDVKFDDGGVPSSDTVDRWLALCDEAGKNGTAIGVHCVAGIGRAPALVTISLVEGGMDPLDAISFIRKHRRGALNKTQVRFIDAHHPRRKRARWLGWFGSKRSAP